MALIPYCLPSLPLLFFCFAKRKVTKEKATFFKMLRMKKDSPTPVTHSSMQRHALVFCLSLTSIEPVTQVRFLFIKQSSYTTSTVKKGAIICSTASLLSSGKQFKFTAPF